MVRGVGTQYTRRNTIAMMTAIHGIEERGISHGMSIRMRASDMCDGHYLDAPDSTPAGSVRKIEGEFVIYVDMSLAFRES